MRATRITLTRSAGPYALRRALSASRRCTPHTHAPALLHTAHTHPPAPPLTPATPFSLSAAGAGTGHCQPWQPGAGPIFTSNKLPAGEVGYPGGIFDPLGYSKGAELASFKLKENKNGRLACLGFRRCSRRRRRAPLSWLLRHARGGPCSETGRQEAGRYPSIVQQHAMPWRSMRGARMVMPPAANTSCIVHIGRSGEEATRTACAACTSHASAPSA
jgi:hypothetical protein